MAEQVRPTYRVVGTYGQTGTIRDFEFAVSHAYHRRTHWGDGSAHVQQLVGSEPERWEDVVVKDA